MDMAGFLKMEKVTVPEGNSGDWSIQKFTVTKEQASFFNIRNPLRPIEAGVYTRLSFKGQTVMSDTSAEMCDHFGVISLARGRVLLNGLGIGMVLQACCLKPEVAHVTVNEISEDVIKLVAPHYLQMFPDKVTINHADALTWKPNNGDKFDIIWHDIWNGICADNYEQMKKLHLRYRHWGKWQGSWCRDEVRRAMRRDSLGIF